MALKVYKKEVEKQGELGVEEYRRVAEIIFRDFYNTIMEPVLQRNSMIQTTANSIEITHEINKTVKYNFQISEEWPYGNPRGLAFFNSNEWPHQNLFVVSVAIENYNPVKNKFIYEIHYYEGNGIWITSQPPVENQSRMCIYWSDAGECCYTFVSNVIDVHSHFHDKISSTGLQYVTPHLEQVPDQHHILLVSPLSGIFTLRGIYKAFFRQGAIVTTEIEIAGKGKYVTYNDHIFWKVND